MEEGSMGTHQLKCPTFTARASWLYSYYLQAVIDAGVVAKEEMLVKTKNKAVYGW
jgi:hypothetical protein